MKQRAKYNTEWLLFPLQASALDRTGTEWDAGFTPATNLDSASACANGRCSKKGIKAPICFTWHTNTNLMALLVSI